MKRITRRCVQGCTSALTSSVRNPRRRAAWSAALLSSAAALTIGGSSVRAAELSWSADGQTPASGGAGLWNTSDLRWWNGSSYVAWNNGGNDTAVFGGSAGSLFANAPVSFGGLAFNSDMFLGAFSGSGYTWGGSALTLQVAGGTTATVLPSIAGASDQTLTKTGTGTFRFFNNIASNVGTINLAAGTLAFAGAGSDLSNGTHLEIAPGAALDMGLVSDTFGGLGGAGSVVMRPLQNLGIVTGPILNIGTNNQSTTYAGSITGTGARLTKSGSGNLILSGANTFTGRVLVSTGTLTLAGGSAISDQAYVGLTTGSGLVLNNSETIGALGSNGLATVNLQNNTLTIGADNYPLAQFGGVIDGSGTLIKVGSGQQQLNLTANQSNYTGGTILRGGQLLVVSDRKLGAVPGAPAVNVTFDGGAMVNANTLNLVLDANRLIEITSNNGTFTTVNSSTVTRVINYGGVVSGAGTLVKDGPGSLVFTEQPGSPLQSHTYSGGTDIRDGQLTSQLATSGLAGTPLGTGSVAMSYSRLAFLPMPGSADVQLAVATDPGRTFTYGPGSELILGKNTNNSNQVTIGPSGAGASSLVRGANGSLVITPTNGIGELGLPGNGLRLLVNGGVPSANGGTPAVNGEMVSGSIISTTSINDHTGEFLRYDNADGFKIATYSTVANINSAGGNDVFNATAAAGRTLTAPRTVHAINVRDGQTVDGPHRLTVGNGSGAAGVILTNASINTSELAFGGAHGVIYAGGPGDGPSDNRIGANIIGTAGISKVGSGTLILEHNGPLGYSGPTQISRGALRTTVNNQLPSSTVVTIGNVGTLDLNGTEQTVAAIHGGAAFVSGINLGNDGRLTVGPGSSTFLGDITGSGTSTLVKDGAGVLTLGYPVSHANLTSGTNTFNRLVLRNGAELNVSADRSLGATPAAGPDPAIPGNPDAITLDGGTLRWTGVTIGTNTPAAGAAQTINNQRGMVIGPNGATIDVTEPFEILVYQRGNAEVIGTDNRNLIRSADLNNPGVITKKGPGFFRLGIGNEFAGKWVVQEGNLQFQSDRSLGVEPAVLVPDAITLDGGMIQSNGTGSLSPNRGVTVTPNGGMIQGFTFNAPITGPGAITKVVANTSTFNAPSPGWTGGVIFSQGTMVFNANDAAGTGTIVFDDSNFVKVLAKTATSDVTLGNPITLNVGGLADVRVTNGTLSLSGRISGPADLAKGVAAASVGTLVLGSNTSDFTGRLIINDGAVVVTGTQALGAAAGATIVNPGATLAFENVGNYAIAERMYIGGVGNTAEGALRNLGGNNVVPGPVIATQDAIIGIPSGNLTVGPVVGNSIVTKNGPGTLAAQHYRVHTLTVDEGTVRVTQKPSSGDLAGTSRVKELNLAGGASPSATLDLTNNALVVDYDGPSPLPTLRAQIVNAYSGGTWSQPGITSSLANAGQFAVGYAEASGLAVIPAVFGSVDGTSVLMRYTRYGDADLNGLVNLGDFNRLAANFGSSDRIWSQGDFNYDGIVNLADFNRLAANFGLQAGPDGPTPDDWSALASAVPEPAGLGVVGMLAAGLLARRRRHGA